MKNKELSTADKLLWLVNKVSIDTWDTQEKKAIKTYNYGKEKIFAGKTWEETINTAYDWVGGE